MRYDFNIITEFDFFNKEFAPLFGQNTYLDGGNAYGTGWERTVHVSHCPALYSGRIFVPLCRELIIFVF